MFRFEGGGGGGGGEGFFSEHVTEETRSKRRSREEVGGSGRRWESQKTTRTQSKDNRETVTTKGNSMRNLDGWFAVSLVDGQEIKVRESDLFNVKKYMIPLQSTVVRMQENVDLENV